MVLIQEGDQLFYECCKDVHVGEELLIWYGSCYTLSMGVPVDISAALKEGLLKLSPVPELDGMIM